MLSIAELFKTPFFNRLTCFWAKRPFCGPFLEQEELLHRHQLLIPKCPPQICATNKQFAVILHLQFQTLLPSKRRFSIVSGVLRQYTLYGARCDVEAHVHVRKATRCATAHLLPTEHTLAHDRKRTRTPALAHTRLRTIALAVESGMRLTNVPKSRVSVPTGTGMSHCTALSMTSHSVAVPRVTALHRSKRGHALPQGR